ncbi:unnamed protein product [Rotaria socialis]|uniref:Arginase n=1 Tax=Rotaria socialis TaxID=392032 RepID=A0A819XX43_9BILA|nr:unnamed protein product [Rotaria socialis]CAF3404520.1 unnamed protein product [Rotaria socialis]CAF3405181.1 unnamed protein product [Rotaria socialis]CAF3417487.1 unnamed protein product [Rotaria socialis]CAF3742606.1 unnamed protein product [Rotaria socialis]
MLPVTKSAIGIVQYPCKLGQRKDGVDQTPDCLLESISAIAQKESKSVRIYDSPKIRNLNKMQDDSHKEKHVFEVNLALRELVLQSLRENDKTLNIGGDHSMGLGTVSAFLTAYPKDSLVIWIDAHADLNTRASSPSGNFHGMPLSFILGIDKDNAFPMTVHLNHQHLAYIGIRDLDPFEIETIAKLNICTVTPAQLATDSEFHVREFVKNFIGEGKTVHISWDVDSTDPSTEITSTGTTADGGIKCSHVKELIKAVTEYNKLVSLDVTELNLSLGANEEERRRSLDHTLDVIKFFIDW